MSLPPILFLPATLAEHSVESLYAEHGAFRPWIYWLGLLGVGATLGALPFVPVEITVRSSGVIRPAAERTELKAALGGRIARVLAHDNDHVMPGQPLVELAAGDAVERLARDRALQRQKSELVADLIELTAGLARASRRDASLDKLPALAVNLRSAVPRREHAQFLAQYEVDRLAAIRARRIEDRTTGLAAAGLVTAQERDEVRFAAQRASADLELRVEQALAGWQSRLRDEQTALDQLASEETRIREELDLAVIRAPSAGTVQGLVGLAAGAVLTAGQSCGYVSPDGPLVAETYVSPKDIGGLHVGQRVRLQIDAYAYTQWGMLDGWVLAVAGDAVTIGQQAAFKVTVRPAAPALRLRNGAVGPLRKGMSLTARFVAGRRSLLRVLYEDASAWLGPQDRPSPS